MFALSAFVLLGALASESPIHVDGWTCHPTRLMVKSTTPPTAVALKIGGRVLASFPAIGWSVVEVPLGRLKQSKALIESSNGVQLVQYDRAVLMRLLCITYFVVLCRNDVPEVDSYNGPEYAIFRLFLATFQYFFNAYVSYLRAVPK